MGEAVWERSESMKDEAGGIGSVGFGRRMDPGSAVWYMGNLFGILAGSEETGRRFALIETLSRKSTEPPRHFHRDEDEAWYVLEGEISFYIGDETHRATPGQFVFAPRGVPHSFVFETDVIRMLILLAPGGPEEHFRDPRFSEPARRLTLPPPPEGPPDVAALVADMERYGVEVVGPPGPPEQG
jgi:quercetin dioxygenase-like cupin family protein